MYSSRAPAQINKSSTGIGIKIITYNILQLLKEINHSYHNSATETADSTLQCDQNSRYKRHRYIASAELNSYQPMRLDGSHQSLDHSCSRNRDRTNMQSLIEVVERKVTDSNHNTNETSSEDAKICYDGSNHRFRNERSGRRKQAEDIEAYYRSATSDNKRMIRTEAQMSQCDAARYNGSMTVQEPHEFSDKFVSNDSNQSNISPQLRCINHTSAQNNTASQRAENNQKHFATICTDSITQRQPNFDLQHKSYPEALFSTAMLHHSSLHNSERYSAIPQSHISRVPPFEGLFSAANSSSVIASSPYSAVQDRKKKDHSNAYTTSVDDSLFEDIFQQQQRQKYALTTKSTVDESRKLTSDPRAQSNNYFERYTGSEAARFSRSANKNKEDFSQHIHNNVMPTNEADIFSDIW